jgi:hypothetical protein
VDCKALFLEGMPLNPAKNLARHKVLKKGSGLKKVEKHR